MEKNKEPGERNRNGKIDHYYKGTIQDETSQFIIHHLRIALEAADPDIYGVFPSKGKRAAVIAYKRENTIFIPVEGFSPLQMIAEVVNRCFHDKGC